MRDTIQPTMLTIQSEQEYRRFYETWQQSRYFVESTARVVPLPREEIS
jgi:hypothetical protein